jgi:hypothetical protein
VNFKDYSFPSSTLVSADTLARELKRFCSGSRGQRRMVQEGNAPDGAGGRLNPDVDRSEIYKGNRRLKYHRQSSRLLRSILGPGWVDYSREPKLPQEQLPEGCCSVTGSSCCNCNPNSRFEVRPMSPLRRARVLKSRAHRGRTAPIAAWTDKPSY